MRAGPDQRCRAVDWKIGVIEDVDIRIVQARRTKDQKVSRDGVVRNNAAGPRREPGRGQQQFSVFSVSREVARECENIGASRSRAPNPLATEESLSAVRATQFDELHRAIRVGINFGDRPIMEVSAGKLNHERETSSGSPC